MVAKNELNTAIAEIESTLRKFPGAKERILVLAADLGHVHAFVGSDRFKNLGPGERQERVWTHLRKNVPADTLTYLYRVYAMSVQEFTQFTREVQLRALSPDAGEYNTE